MESLDDVLSGAEAPAVEAQQQQEAPQGVEQPEAQQPATGDAQTQEQTAEGAESDAQPGSATPARKTETMVPLKALEEERKGRQDWKEKSIRLEEEVKHLRAQHSQTQTPSEQPTQLTTDQVRLNDRLDMSELLLRQQHGDEAVDGMIESFQKAAKENPALGAQLAQQKHPYQWAFEQVKRMKAMEEIGSDPVAYRDRIRTELEAELKAAAQPEQQAADVAAPVAQVAPKPVIPQSLASARSSAPRAAAAWSGPTPLADIIKR